MPAARQLAEQQGTSTATVLRAYAYLTSLGYLQTLPKEGTFVAVPMKQGQSYVQINETAGYLGTCFDCSDSPATNYFQIDVLSLDLREAGKETVTFMFNPIHLCAAR